MMPLNAVYYVAVKKLLNKPLVKQVQDELAQNTATQQFAFLFHIHETPRFKSWMGKYVKVTDVMNNSSKC